MSRKRKVVIHLNKTEDLEFACSIENKINDVYSLIENSKGVTINKQKILLQGKEGLIANLDGRINRDLELWFKPEFDLQEAMKRKIFGKSIDEASKRAKKGLPTVLSVCFKFLQTEKALRTPGIFRFNGDMEKVHELKAQFDNEENVEIPENADPYVVGSVILQYLNELPEPLTLYSEFGKFLEASKSDFPALRLMDQIKSIPSMNQKILQFFIRYLVFAIKYSSENKATPTNLALAVGPVLFKSEDGSEKKENQKLVVNLTKQFIDHYYQIFNVEVKKDDVKVEQVVKTQSGTVVTVDTAIEPLAPMTISGGVKKSDSFNVTPTAPKVVDTAKKQVSDDINEHWQIIIEQWKEKYHKEASDRKKEKQMSLIESEKMQLQIEEMKAQIEKYTDRTTGGNKELMEAEKAWTKKEKEYKMDLDRKDRELRELRERMEDEIIELKKKHLEEMKKRLDVVVDDTLKPEPKVVRKCFACTKVIPTEDFMESGSWLYHEECFKCSKCTQLIDGPFKNVDGILTCKPCLEKKDTPVVTPIATTQPNNTQVPGKIICGACNIEIMPGAAKLKAIEKYYHSACFKCQKCHNDFPDKKFFNLDGAPVCKSCKAK